MGGEFCVIYDYCGGVVEDGAHVLDEGSVGRTVHEILVGGDVVPV